MADFFRNVDLWGPAFLRQRYGAIPDGVKDVMVCVCDHFEPMHEADRGEALARVARWKNEFPKIVAPFADADGVRPRHTFFYPLEQYSPELLDAVADLSRRTGSEVEVHLHHDQDTPGQLTATIAEGKARFQQRGLLSRDAAGRVRYGFVHGNWALCNSHPSGNFCGVDNELAILNDTGCFADFTFPSAPDPTQPRTINRLYYARQRPGPKSHDTGVQIRVLPPAGGFPRPSSESNPRFGDLLVVQGPLGLDWRWRKFGIIPRLENAHLTAANPLRPERMRLWLKLHIHVLGRPEWFFVKLHTHGAIEPNISMFLGDVYRQSLKHLTDTYTEANGWRLHWVTAREMVNIIHAAEDGHQGNAGAFRDYRYRLGKS